MKKIFGLIIYYILIIFIVASVLFTIFFKKNFSIAEIGNDVDYSSTDNVIYSYSELKYRDLTSTSFVTGEINYRNTNFFNIDKPSDILVAFGDILNAGDIIAYTQADTIISESIIKIIDIEDNLNTTKVSYVKLEDAIVVCELPINDYFYLFNENNIEVILSNAKQQIAYEKYIYELNRQTNCYDVAFLGLKDFYIKNETVDIQFRYTEKKHLLLINKSCVYKDENNNYFVRNITIDNEGKVIISKETITVINEYDIFYEVADTDKEGKLYLYY